MSTKKSPRAMPVETIITRNKSRTQQSVQQSQNKNITKPISPKSKPTMKAMKQYPQKSKAVKSKDVQKSSVKTNDVNSREFYPDRPKRNIEYEKVVLKPKHCMKMIGGTKSCNKRKLHMPQKETKRIRHNSNSSTPSDNEPKSPKPKDQDAELTIKDMVLLIEEEGGLNDEDLLEILTCPSPVWWEDPPDGYIEEPIFARPKPAERKSIKNQLLEEQNKEAERRKLRDEELTLKARNTENLDVSKLGISVENRSINFMNKRGKLESLLSSIRNKVKGDNGVLKEKDITANLNANDEKNDKNDKNVNRDANKSQSTESKQETLTKEMAMESIEKCDNKVNLNRNKNPGLEIRQKNIKKCHKNDKNETTYKLRASYKRKGIKNRNKKFENKTKRQTGVLVRKEIINIDENLDNSGNKNQNVASTSESDKSNIYDADVTKGNREKTSSESLEEKLMDIINIDENLDDSANKNQNVESTPESDKNWIKSNISHENETKDSREKTSSESLEEKLKQVINVDENFDDTANKNQNVESTPETDKNCVKSNISHEDETKDSREKTSSESLEEKLKQVINVDENFDDTANKNQNVESTPETDKNCVKSNISHEDETKDSREKTSSESLEEKLKQVINVDENFDDTANKNQNVESTPETDKNCVKSNISHEDKTKDSREKLKQVINVDENFDDTANKNQNVESTLETDKKFDKSNINHKDVIRGYIEKGISESLEEKLMDIINIDENLDDSANKNQNVESTPESDKKCVKSNISHEDETKDSREKTSSESLEEKLKQVINVDENFDDTANKNQNVESTLETDKKFDKSNINHEDVIRGNREKRSSESLEDDLLELEDHEILSLENMEIPVAPNNATNPGKVSKLCQYKQNETISSKANTTNKMSAKIRDAITDNRLGSKINDFITEKGENCTKKKFKINFNKINKKTDIDATNRKILHINTTKRVKLIKNKVSYIQVKKIETLTSLNGKCTNEIISSITLPNNDVDVKKATGSKKGCLNNPTLVKILGKSNFASNNVTLSSRKSSVKSNKSNHVSDRNQADACNMNTEITNDSMKELESLKNVNRLREMNTPVLQQDACIEIQDDDDDDDLNNHIGKTNNTTVQIKNVGGNDTSIQVKTTENHAQDKNVRRHSIDSATSDKNMSVEYLDMSLLDEDERKMDLESRNTEFIYESDDYQSQTGSQSGNKKNHINFKSDLDMTDSNMYDQINESCNNDIIKYIRDNRDEDTIQDTIDNETLNEDFMINNTFRSSSPIKDNANRLSQDKANSNGDKETEYVTVYKVVNSDSEKESNLTKINEVKSGTITEINEVINKTKSNESKIMAANEEGLVENNGIADSELITYEEEYLTEFDEEENVGNLTQIDEVNNTALNVNNEAHLTNSNVSNEVVINVHNQGNSINTNVGNAIEKINNTVDLTEINEIPDTVEDVLKNQDNLSNRDHSKITDRSKLTNNYYKHQKDICKKKKSDEIISNGKPKKENHENEIKIDCKSCNFKNKSILISENENIKYCLQCSSIYDTDKCKYCIKKLKKECSCDNVTLKYVCDKCHMKVDDKEAIIEHLKQNCNE
ncbi:putative leucine-rich repeat-containing protein DDB_G0290503 isoform X1 [Maniola jurtina]|uniref:putative leucine-rich repeat-containing protein DDB_G0290503 isoform X1 n=1 Tax=Maniola jurtina TaxID=191418 RepID=UPI001E6877B2|nr:putative leucine-rich repeat-containing protein DDB_G0290503 isoform X1 [Maniola jurtina]XP_045783110.1 putative leucine-rich repeat-containing protein DDB_G0290503 isoform X1 [Maniola jurtina]XP_045783111.1 putative leucine-rich repeat-containing protein DDB_G0290503 isoform X1 [Maniola jurtina]